MRKFVTAALAAASLAAMTGAAFAHHSTSLGFLPDKRVTVEGQFVGFKWINPHVLMQFEVVDAKGKTALWTAETHSTSVLSRVGWRKNMFKPGDKLTVFGQPGRKDPHAMHMLRVTANGKTYNVNSSGPP